MSITDNHQKYSPSAQLRAIEIISELLASTSPHKLGEVLTAHLRKLTGARTIKVLAHRPQPDFDELLYSSPQLRITLLSSAELNLFCHEATPEELPFLTGELSADHPLHAPLLRSGIHSMARYPLRAGGELVAQLLLFDLPSVERLAETNHLINLIAAPIALALKNALAFRLIEEQAQELEQRVEERTAELRQSEERFKALHNASFGGIAIHDQGVILDCNQGLSEISGFGHDELIGIDGLLLIAEKSREAVMNNIRSGCEKPYEAFGLRKSGEEYHLRLEARNIPYHGKMVRAVEFRDITDRKRLEEEKLLLEQQFQQTQKLESLGVLAGGIAHDFNNILAIIMGYCGLTKMDYEDAEKHIPEIEKAVERAAALCRQMLAYAGKAMLTESQVNVWMLVDEMVAMLKTTIQQNVVLKPELDTDIPFIMGDASQLRQVVMNLIINAAEAIGDAEGEIDIKLAKAEIRAEQPEQDHLGVIIPAGRYICFEVSDNGCGMDDETRSKIFEPFYTTKFTGRGLGMSAVLGIIKAHNGALQLESRLGHGTTFKIFLPAQLSTSETGEAQQLAAAAAWQGSGTVLLAEDEVQVKAIAIAMLQKLGFTVLDAANGKEALELYQQNAADITLVVTDMGMPVMNGYELFYRLKQLNPQLPIMISSGFGEADITSKIPREAMAGLINKPYRFDQLREVLRGVVGIMGTPHA